MNEDSDPVILFVKFPLIGMDRHDHEIVLRLSERAADGSGNSNDLIFMRFGAQGLADRVHVREQLGGYVGADKHNLRAMFVIGFGNHAALRYANVANVGVVWGNAHHIGSLEPFVTCFQVHVAVVQRGDGVRGFHVVAQILEFIHGQQGPLLRFHPCVVAGDDAKAIHDIDVRAQIGDAIRDVKVHPGDNAHHDHKSRYRQNHA